MSGFSNITGDESVIFVDNASFDGTERGGTLTQDGELWIGSSVAPHVRKNLLTAGPGISINNSPGDIMISSITASPPAFHASLTVSQVNVTGDGTLYTIIFDSDSSGFDYDVGNNYNNATGVFTAPQNGVYMFTINLGCQGINNNNQHYSHSLYTVSGATTTDHTFASGNAALMRDLITTTNSFNSNGNLIVKMASGDTAMVKIDYYGNGSKNVTVVETTNAHDTSFSGILLFTY